MKKRICLFLIMVICIFCSFAQSNSRLGYFKLDWGSTVEDAQKAGYKLSPVTEKVYNNFQKSYVETVDVYSVKNSKDKEPMFLYFLYYNERLTYVREILPPSYTKQSKVEKRYGKYDDNGIEKFGESSYSNLRRNKDNKVDYWSIVVYCGDIEYVQVETFDWNVYKSLDKSIRKVAAGVGINLSESFQTISKKLVQSNNKGKKASIAVMNIDSDNGNQIMDTYVSDSLIEAIFGTGAFTIFERAKKDKLLEELKFQSSGLVNEASAKKIGDFLGVDYVCYGTYKDTGDNLQVNIRMVDVESGEICAMSSDSVPKDEYIKSNGANGGIAKAPEPSKKTKKDPPVAKTAKVKTMWRCYKHRNDFDGYTTYTFILRGPENVDLIVGYDKNDNPSSSIVRAGINWRKNAGLLNDFSGAYDLKLDDGTIHTKKFYYAYWSDKSGWKTQDIPLSQLIGITYNSGESARFMIDLFGSNNYLTVRKHGIVQKFQPAGFWDYLASQGISQQEIYDAISNEEF